MPTGSVSDGKTSRKNNRKEGDHNHNHRPEGVGEGESRFLNIPQTAPSISRCEFLGVSFN